MILQPWHIQLFGSLRACQNTPQGERIVTRFRSQKYGALLAYLAFHRGHSHPREVLIELLWTDSPSPESGRHRLSLALSSLRAQFEPPGIPAGSIIIADRLSVELNPDAFSTDVQSFEDALRLAARVPDDERRLQRLVEAADLYGGQLLPGYYEDWIALEGERLRERYLEALQRLVPLLERRGETARAIQYARQAVDTDRAREEAHGELIRVLLAAGQPEAALRQWREMERALSEELADEPGQASRQLLREIERRLAGVHAAAPIPDPPSVPSSNSVTFLGLRGTLTFLLTDIEGSTAHWERSGEAFRGALTRHHILLRDAFRRHGGREIKEVGDGFLSAFASVSDALACAVAAQRALSAEPWSPEVGMVQVRMALHTSDVQADIRDDVQMDISSAIDLSASDYHDLVLHRAARILSAAHGGQVLCSEAAVGVVRRDLEVGISLIDLGLYRLRDISNPERLFQVEWAGMTRSAFPSPAAERAHRGSLPLQFTRFFGREAEIAGIGELLQGGVRLLTLTGTGGTGKTRLAIEAACRLWDYYSGAVWFVPLADVEEAALILSTVRDVLGLPPSAGQEPLLEEVAGALSRQQPSLLILDNFEQTVESGGSEIVQALLTRASSLTCLVTSRQLLGLPGEQEFPVPSLATPSTSRPGSADEPGDLSLYDSVRLFVDRAQAVKPDFQVTNANAAALAALVDRLEGIPLAIELAAARAQVLTPAQMLSQLDKRFEFLVSRRRGVAERQRTLRAAVDWSYRLLSPELQRFFAQLSVLRGVWTEAAAEAVTGETLALDLLAQLRESSLVTTQEAPGEYGPEMRFRLLESLREFAEERLAAFPGGEEGNTLRRHGAYFRRFARERIDQVRGPGEAAALHEAAEQAPNLRAALEAVHGESGEVQVIEARAETALLLGMLLSRRGFAREAVLPIQEGLEMLEAFPIEGAAALLAGLRADLLRERAGLHFDLNEADLATERANQALSLYRTLGDERCMAQTENLLGLAAMAGREYEGARKHLNTALAYALSVGDRVEAGNAYNNLGLLECSNEAGSAEAARHLEEALRLRRGCEDRRGVAETLNNLGILAQAQDQRAAAQRWYTEALDVEREMGHGFGVARALSNLGEIAEAQGALGQACRLFTAAEYLFEQVQSPYAGYVADLRVSVAARLSDNNLNNDSEGAQALPGFEEGSSLDDLITWALQTTKSSDAPHE